MGAHECHLVYNPLIQNSLTRINDLSNIKVASTLCFVSQINEAQGDDRNGPGAGRIALMLPAGIGVLYEKRVKIYVGFNFAIKVRVMAV